jgi:hypothetical protein
MASAILIHSVSWLAAALVADPQRLILGIPWYLTVALAFGAAVPLLWAYLAISTSQGIVSKSWSTSDTLVRLLMTFCLGLYIPFVLYWQLALLPVP